MTRPSIEATGLSKRFGGYRALDSATFRYEGAGAIGYLGPNGAGKTTTLKLFTHLLRPSSGTAQINGLDVASHPKQALWDVGSVIETPEPYPSQTVREALEMVGEFRGLPKRKVAEQIGYFNDKLELPPLDRPTGKLSKGQRQRVVIAGALLSDPSVLLLDEPTSGLDPAERVAVRNLLLELKKDRLILMSSHLLPEVTEVCDRVIFVNQGKILLQDTVSGIAKRFQVTQVDVEFLGRLPTDAVGRLRPPAKSGVRVDERRLRIEFDGSDEARAGILTQCLAIGPVISFSNSSLSLEDAYLRLVGPPPPPPPHP